MKHFRKLFALVAALVVITASLLSVTPVFAQGLVGFTEDGCDNENTVVVYISPGHYEFFDATEGHWAHIEETTEMTWWCGEGEDVDQERVANDVSFDWFYLYREPNGALKWYFYRSY